MPAATRPELTRHQEAALRLIADGLTLQEVADELGVSRRTAKYYSDVLRAKLGAKRMRDLVVLSRDYFKEAAA